MCEKQFALTAITTVMQQSQQSAALSWKNSGWTKN